MLTNSFLKLQSNNPSTGIFHSDNLSTYFYLTDLKNEFNGLWSNGFHLFRAIYPKIKTNKSEQIVITKSITPMDCFIACPQNHSASFILLDGGKGFIADFR